MWTLNELVDQAAAAIGQLPSPTNGQIRAVPDERTIRYYATIGLLDRPSAMRGRTALYDRKHLAQVVAIKRLQGAGRSLAEIQALWPTLEDHDLGRMAGIPLKGKGTRREFWKQEPARTPVTPRPRPAAATPLELRVELAPGCFLSVAVTGDVHLTAADASALRAAAAPLVAELARRGLTAQTQEDT
ncbi:MAG: MerR family transcriptional regulator [Kofleriaceae bacterium]